MSHFPLTVVLKDPDKLADMLAPFDENIEVEPYWEPAYDADRHATVADYMAYIRSAYEEAFQPGGNQNIRGNWVRRYGDLRPENATDEQLLEDWNGGQPYRDGPTGLETQSTYNPRSKWDWWVIGGRWTGYFPVRAGYRGHPRLIRGEGGLMTPPNVDPNRADGGPKAMLDLNAVRSEAGHHAALQARYVRAKGVTALPPPPGKDSDRDAWRAWWDDPAVQIIAEEREDSPFGFMPDAHDLHDAVVMSEEEYIAHKARVNFPTWALLTPEGWAEKGQMGFWAMSDKTPESEAEYADVYAEVIEHTPDDWYLICCDLHI